MNLNNDQYTETCFDLSKRITERYSTSFTLGIKTLHQKLRLPIFGIYGFVRLADEIVDTFHHHDKQLLLQNFKTDTYDAIERKLSTNPVLHAFQHVVNSFGITKDLIEAFLYSMEMDLTKKNYSSTAYKEYIYGSAEVVGLMCLHVFCDGDKNEFEKLKPFACKLGSAFQKINFLRDIKSDYDERERIYFPDIDFDSFSDNAKKEIETDIKNDFNEGLKGIKMLPASSRFGVTVAYTYYVSLFKKIKKLPANKIRQERIRISDFHKFVLLISTFIKNKLGLI